MKKVLSFVCLAIILASCNLNIDSPDKPKDVDPTAVGFNVYVNRGLQTKAGWGGVLTLDELKDGTKANGFGVFAYYGNGALYNETMIPDFMYDQQVKFRTDYNVWDYTPIKYWPNEFGEAASSEAADRLTFFAYAPYVDVIPSTGVVTGDATTGIIGMSRNISKGDPVVMYSSSLTPGNSVDLCWGVAAELFTSSVDGDNNNVAAGYPFINVIKPKTGDHLKFEFNHALAQLNMQIDADINNEVSGDGKTKIYVRSVTFNGFSMRGSLNLNSNKTDGPIWYDISGSGRLKREPVTVYDGRTDGMEGVTTAVDVSEKPADLNPNIIQSLPYGDAGLTPGVTTTAVNLFNNTEAEAPVMVIPTPGVPMSVTIVYDVETEDGRLAGYLSDGVTHGSSVENKITKTITTDQGNMILSAGKKYVVKLHLGLTSVKFDAAVAVWDNTSYEGTAYLPENTTSLGTVAITDGSSSPTPTPLTSLTMWKGETMSTAPGVIVKDEHGDTITGYDVEWTSSNTNVATVAADGKVTPVAPGTATITVKASVDKKVAWKSYTLYVNELTGITLSSTTPNIVIGSTLPVKATFEINGGQDVYGDITTKLPDVTWVSSASDKVSVDTPTTSTKDGDDYVSTTTATAANASTVAIGDQTIIKASVGELDSNELTLTCTNVVTGVTLDPSATTVTIWRYMGYTVPTVTVQGSGGADLTSLATISWKLDNNPVTVTNNVIALPTAGEHTVTVTVSYNDSEESATITVFANEVTGISVAPATVTVQKNATTTLTATLTKTSYGTALANPTISWSSGSTSYVTVSPATGTSTTASGVAAGSSTVTASIPADYMQSGITNSATSTVQCVTPSMTAFRGYEVSPGILMRTVDSGTSEVSYSLTNGSNPFEPAIYYGQSSSIGTYFLTWSTLVTDLGTESSGIIDADSEKLPSGWILPSAGERSDANPLTSDWGKIIWGTTKSTITVNGTSVTKNAYAMVKVTLDEGNSYGVPARTYYGTLLLRDGMTIPSGYLNVVGSGNYDSNPLDETKFKALIDDYKCLFLSMTGMWSSGRGWEEMYSSMRGYYRARNSTKGIGYWLRLETGGGFTMNSTKSSGNSQPAPVKLVKPVTDD